MIKPQILVTHQGEDMVMTLRSPGSPGDSKFFQHNLSEVETSPDLAYQALGSEISNGLEEGRIVILGPTLFGFDWESTHIPQPVDRKLGLIPSFTVIRTTSSDPYRFDSVRASNVRVLVISANPRTQEFPFLPSLNLEVDQLKQILCDGGIDENRVRVLSNATKLEVKNALIEVRPTIVHFAGHSCHRRTGWSLVLRDGNNGDAIDFHADELGEWMTEAGVRLFCSFSCDSALKKKGGILEVVEHTSIPAIGFDGLLDDGCSTRIARDLYLSLVASNSIETAVAMARQSIQDLPAEWQKLTHIQSTPAPIQIFGKDTKIARHNIDDTLYFVGRKGELKALTELIRSRRLVNLTGIGGMGKSHCARHLGHRLASTYNDGAWLVECETATNSLEVLEAIANTLGCPFESETIEEATSCVCQYIGSKEYLLILDCFEHLVGDAKFLTQLARTCKNCKILVTSRKLLGLPIEYEYRLTPLSLEPSEEGRSEAAQLFLDSAAQTPNSGYLDTQIPVVESTVDVLQGIPLAIVLATKRLRSMGIEDLLARLHQSMLEVLKGSIDDEDRHSSVFRVIKDSLDMVRERERTAIAKLSIFRGGFTLVDAEALLDLPDVLDVISVLCDNSLLSMIHRGQATRYVILDSIGEFVRADLSSEEKISLSRRHAEIFASKASQLRRWMDEGNLQTAVDAFWADVSNFRSAFIFVRSDGNDKLIEEFVFNLARLVFEAGISGDFRTFSNSLAEMKSPKIGVLIEFKGLEGAHAKRHNEFRRAQEIWQERVELCRSIGDYENQADTLLDLTDLMMAIRDIDQARIYLNEFDRVVGKVGSQEIRISGTLIRAQFAHLDGNNELCLTLLLQACAALDTIQDNRFTLFVLLKTSMLFRDIDKLKESLQFSVRLVKHARERGYLQTVGRGLFELSITLEKGSDLVLAVRCLDILHRMPTDVSPQLKQAGHERRFALTDTAAADPQEGDSTWEQMLDDLLDDLS